MNMSKVDRKVLRVYRAAMRWYQVIDRVNRPYTETSKLFIACAAAKKGKRK